MQRTGLALTDTIQAGPQVLPSEPRRRVSAPPDVESRFSLHLGRFQGKDRKGGDRPFCLSVFVSLSVSPCLSVHLSLSVSLSICLSLSLCPSVSLSLSIYLSLSLCIPLCLSLSVSLFSSQTRCTRVSPWLQPLTGPRLRPDTLLPPAPHALPSRLHWNLNSLASLDAGDQRRLAGEDFMNLGADSAPAMDS